MILFEWDEAKNEANRRKHGIRFESVFSVFSDPQMLLTSDRIIDGEQRWHAIGITSEAVLLLVVHTQSEAQDESGMETIRLISARKATRQERKDYE